MDKIQREKERIMDEKREANRREYEEFKKECQDRAISMVQQAILSGSCIGESLSLARDYEILHQIPEGRAVRYIAETELMSEYARLNANQYDALSAAYQRLGDSKKSEEYRAISKLLRDLDHSTIMANIWDH